MEDVQDLFQQREYASSSESNNSSTSSQKNFNSKIMEKQRNPTRRPNPNVYNRNALLARENRLKKKAHLESIEKELNETRSANRALMKALKKQFKITRRLEQEKRYFKNIVVNRTEILSLVSALNERMPMSSERSSISSENSIKSPFRHNNSAALSITFDQTDNDFEPTSSYDDTWNALLEDDSFGLKESTDKSPKKDTSMNSHVANEHSYVAYREAAHTDTNLGVCLHIARGKVSLEYCPSCHWNACGTPPLQLLEDDDSG